MADARSGKTRLRRVCEDAFGEWNEIGPNSDASIKIKSNDTRRIEATEWARRFKTECWASYAEAVKLAEVVDRAVLFSHWTIGR